MRVLIRSKHVWIHLILFVGFCLFASFVAVEKVLTLTNCFVLVAATVCAFRYFVLAVRAIRRRQSVQAQYVAIGIAEASSASAGWRIWSLVWLYGGQIPAFVQNDIVAAFQFAIAIGLTYHISVPREDGSWTRWRLAVVAGVVVGTLVLAGALVWLDPDTTWIVKTIVPLIPR